jgi:hypothetical protein
MVDYLTLVKQIDYVKHPACAVTNFAVSYETNNVKQYKNDITKLEFSH